MAPSPSPQPVPLATLQTLPAGALWDHYCLKQEVPIGMAWMDEVKAYEAKVTSKR